MTAQNLGRGVPLATTPLIALKYEAAPLPFMVSGAPESESKSNWFESKFESSAFDKTECLQFGIYNLGMHYWINCVEIRQHLIADATFMKHLVTRQALVWHTFSKSQTVLSLAPVCTSLSGLV